MAKDLVSPGLRQQDGHQLVDQLGGDWEGVHSHTGGWADACVRDFPNVGEGLTTERCSANTHGHNVSSDRLLRANQRMTCDF